MKKIFSLIIFLFHFKAFAYQNDFALKLGAAYTFTDVSSVTVTNTYPLGFGMSSHIGYRFHRWEYNASSYLNVSRIKKMQVDANGSKITGDGNFQSVTFGPTVRHYLLNDPLSFGLPYFVMGAHTLMQTMEFGINSVEITGGRFSQKHKLTFEGYGLLAGFGIDKTKDIKENYYIEIVYIANKSKKISEVGGTNTLVELINRESTPKPIYEQTIFISIGKTLF